MTPAALPLNALRAFEAAARHLSFTRAADELCVTQGAVSHQVRALEARLGVTLFRRMARGLALTDEAEALIPALSQAFGRIGDLLDEVQAGKAHQALTLGVVNTFAVGWLLPRLDAFRAAWPFIDLRLRTHNNKVDLLAERLDGAIQFGDGVWPGLEAQPLMHGALSPLCSPRLARGLGGPADLAQLPLLRSYRADEWPRWFRAAGIEPPPMKGPQFDSSIAMVAAAQQSAGVALAPPAMFAYDIRGGRLVQPFDISVQTGAYYLTRVAGRPASEALQAFTAWVLAQGAE
ncbi:transcriptional regulator GcvA [Caulobacter sp. KR2-114]|uniref:transcriptional regulator GcvA n=1 Tax=Caulobacter sp. KR2-114 TaxID=3400912 RepID=UPI003BFED7D3